MIGSPEGKSFRGLKMLPLSLVKGDLGCPALLSVAGKDTLGST